MPSWGLRHGLPLSLFLSCGVYSRPHVSVNTELAAAEPLLPGDLEGYSPREPLLGIVTHSSMKNLVLCVFLFKDAKWMQS